MKGREPMGAGFKAGLSSSFSGCCSFGKKCILMKFQFLGEKLKFDLVIDFIRFI